MTTDDHALPRDYFFLAWEISSLERRTALAAGAFLFEAFIAIASLMLTAIRNGRPDSLTESLNTALIFLIVFILPVAILCWLIWHRDSARLRELNTEPLNNFADASSFTVPRMSPLTMKYAPEAAAVLAIQAIAAIYFSAVGPFLF